MAYRRGFNLGAVEFLIIANLIFFIPAYIRPDILYRFGFYPSEFLSKPWTIVTSLFLHASIGHILGNMLTLYYFGNYLIALVGELKFFIIYFLGGIIGCVFCIFLLPPYGPVVGASGAIFAVGGALAVMRPRLSVYVFPIPAPVPLWVAVVGGFLIMTVLFLSTIAWQAHLGGLLVGALFGLIYRRRGYR